MQFNKGINVIQALLYRICPAINRTTDVHEQHTIIFLTNEMEMDTKQEKHDASSEWYTKYIQQSVWWTSIHGVTHTVSEASNWKKALCNA